MLLFRCTTLRTTRIAKYIFVIVSTIICIIAVWKLYALLRYEMHPAHHGWDGAIYTAVGRGILNGLRPYADLFETKPPGMFLISAASLWFFNDIRLGNWLQGIVEMSLLAALLLPVLRQKNTDWYRKLPWVISTMLFGILLILYLTMRAGHFQTESFGSFFVGLYIAITVIYREQWSVRHYLASSILLCAAIWLKEPFVVVAFAAVLLILQKPFDMLWYYVVPVATALIMGIVVMAALGYLDPYVHIYLPEMLYGRAHTYTDPFWMLAFLLHFIVIDITRFSPMFTITLIGLWSCSLLCNTEAWQSRRKQIALISLLGCLFVMIAIEKRMLIYFAGEDLLFDRLLLPAVIFFGAYWCGAWFGLCRFFEKKEASIILRGFALHITVIVLTTMVVGMGGFLQQQYGFITSTIVALYFSVYIHFSKKKNVLMPIAIAVLASFTILTIPTEDYGEKVVARVRTEHQRKQNAATIDAIMDRCDYQRYLILGEPSVPYEFTAHSPYGPAFHRISFAFPVSWRPPPQPYLQQEYLKNIHETQFIIARQIESEDEKTALDGNNIPSDVSRYIERHFTTKSPACAQNTQSMFDQFFLFRLAEPL